MPSTLTLTPESATKALADLQQQQALVETQLATCVDELGAAEPGTAAHLDLSQRAAALKQSLNALQTQVALLTPQAKGEAQRKAEAEAKAAKARAELEAKAQADLAHIEKLVNTINKCSDALSSAITELATGDHWASQRATGGPSLDTVGRSLRRIIDEIPSVYVSPLRVSVRRRAENGKGYRQ